MSAKNDRPLAGVGVHTSQAVSTVTDQAGQFRIAGVCTGDVLLVFDHEDHDPHDQLVHVDSFARVTVRLSPGETIIILGEANKPIAMVASTVLTKEELARTQGKSFAEALENVPGVALLRSSNGTPKPILRGQFGRRLVTLIDGVRHESQKWGRDHSPEIDPFIAGKIRVIRGASAVRHGPDAVGGVVEVESNRLPREPGFNGSAQLTGTSNGLGGGAGARVGYASEKLYGFAALLEASGRKQKARVTPDYALDNTGVEEWSVGASLGYRTNAFTSRLTWRRYQAELGNCLCVRNDSFEDLVNQQGDRPIGSENFQSSFAIARPFQRVRHDSLLANARYVFNDIGALKAAYGFQENRRKEFDTVRTDTDDPQFDFQLRTHNVELEFEATPIDIGSTYHLHSSVGASVSLQENIRGGLSLVPDHDAASFGFYLIERLLGKSTELELGLRYDRLARTASFINRDFTRLVRSGQIETGVCDSQGEGSTDRTNCETSLHAFSASLGGLWVLSDELTTKFSLSSASRFPNPDEQYLNGTSPTFPVLGLGKPDLGVETTFGSSLTGEYRGGKLSAEASVYGNYIKDYIYFAPVIDGAGEPVVDVLVRGSVPRFATNPVDAVFYGVEAGLRYQPNPRWELGGQLAVVRAKDVENDSFLVFVPPDRLRAEVAFLPPDSFGFSGTRLSIRTTLVAEQDRVDPNADLIPPPSRYALLGAEVSTNTVLAGQPTRLSITGKNLLNTRYRDYTSLLRYFADEPGWELTLRLRVDFNN